MKLLITGGAGFIGSNFTRWILAREPGVSVVNLDKLTYAGNPENLRGLDAGCHRFLRGDVADPAAVEEAIFGCDALVHFAAETH
ncbi:MAG: GDP-mannose 4,6-dehydratase, partial [Candidatus Omnitrophota bacterium]|nr:GDP-mannose 4,6-dehydratase [Candidatus Omnitrophota bacterium]